MLFNSFIFLIFLGLIIPLYHFTKPGFRKPMLLAASYFFYGYWDYRFCSLLLLSTVVDYYTGNFIYNAKKESSRKKIILISLIVNLGILAVFKYFNFFVESFNSAFSATGTRLDFLHLNIILPVGISFYTFQTLTYTIDIYRKEIKPAKSFVDFALYVSFFPQLVAGPIERAKALLPQIERMPTATKEQFRQGFVLITIGMFKKVLIGDTSGRIVDQIFTQPQYYSSSEMLMGLILFSIQIYADFSGYSSIARGTAKWMGIELMENFNQPYLSQNITEFWRRWHISLSTWLKDYLYISLGGNRKGKTRTYVNLMITMLLGGLWHGAAWTFVIWGGLHGIYLAIHKFILGNKKIPESYRYDSLQGLGKYLVKVIFLNILVLITWLFFRAKTFGEAAYFIERFIYWERGDFDARVIAVTCSFGLMIIMLDFCEYYFKDHAFLLRLKAEYRYGIAASCWLVIMLYMFQAVPMPFIYFQF